MVSRTAELTSAKVVGSAAETAEAEEAGGAWVKGLVGSARITKVGLWLTLLTMILSVAAANTGNNSLYLVIAGTTSLLIVAWWTARRNARGHEFRVEGPDEIYAGSPATLRYEVRRRASGQSTDLLLLIEGSSAGTLLRKLDGPSPIRRLQRRSSDDFVTLASPDLDDQHLPVASGEQQVLYLRRGVQKIGQAKALSLFPMGFFRHQIQFRPTLEVIVLPEIFAGVRTKASRSPRGWRHSGQRIGRSEDLHSLRDWRAGDDPRSIHWKQSARNSRLIFQERSEDESRRVSIAVDSAVPDDVAHDDQRFERLISEAATACVEYLEHGYEVELLLREGSIEYGSGPWQRRRLLEALALVESRPATEAERAEDADRRFLDQAGRTVDLAQTDVLRFSLQRSREQDGEPQGDGALR